MLALELFLSATGVGLVACAAVACAATTGLDAVGFSTLPDDGASVAERAAAPTDDGPRWSVAAQLSQWPEAARFTSRGHVPASQRAAIIVASSPAVAAAYSQSRPDTSFPPGSTLAQLLSPPASDAWEVAYVMERTAHGWRYFLADPSGRTVSRNHELCAACHQSKGKAVFGAPVGAAPSETAIQREPATK